MGIRKVCFRNVCLTHNGIVGSQNVHWPGYNTLELDTSDIGTGVGTHDAHDRHWCQKVQGRLLWTSMSIRASGAGDYITYFEASQVDEPGQQYGFRSEGVLEPTLSGVRGWGLCAHDECSSVAGLGLQIALSML